MIKIIKQTRVKVAVIALLLGIGVLLHQYLTFGKLFEIEQFLHHENIALVLIIFAVGVMYASRKSIVKIMRRR